MDDIKRSFVLQWGGPFRTEVEMHNYIKRGRVGEVCSSDCFNFYYLTGINNIGRPKLHRYFGIHHKLDGIEKRLNSSHRALSLLKKDDNLHIWLGSFANLDDHEESWVEDVETLFIRHYRDLMTYNEKKKKTELRKLASMSIVNLWYDCEERPWKRKPTSASIIDDVMVWENDAYRFLSAHKMSEQE